MSAPAIDTVRDALRGVADPEAGIDIVELGLIYDIAIDDLGIRIAMATTSPACPTAPMMIDAARAAVARIADGRTVEIKRVWDPPWGPERMSEDAKRKLGW